MEMVLGLLILQGLMGAFDNLWHHEFTENLPNTPSARTEIALHSARELIYGVVFLMLGWGRWYGWLAAALAALIMIEVFITLWDFLEEDMTRKLPPLERILHTLLAMNYGAVLLALTPVIWGWSKGVTHLEIVSYGWLSWIMTLYGIGVLAWGVRDLIAAFKPTKLQVPHWKRHPMEAAPNKHSRDILITGGTGFIGHKLCRHLITEGHRLTVLTRKRSRAEYLYGPHAKVVESLEDLAPDTPLDAIINLAGEPVMGLPWTKHQRAKLLASRIGTTQQVNVLIDRLARKPECLINASAIGYYGTQSGTPLTEDSPPTGEFISELCRSWEEEAARAERHDVRVVCLRLGIVLGTTGGSLPQLIAPVKAFSGAIMGTGKHWMAWLHIDDAIGLTCHALENTAVKGSMNAVAPEDVTHGELMGTIGKVLRRPIWLRIPAFVLRTLLGEMSTVLLDGARVKPLKANATGYRFKHPTLEPALRDLLLPKLEAATVYFNGDCPVCRHEIAAYKRQAEHGQAPIVFADISKSPDLLKERGINDAALERRLHAVMPDGTIIAGAATFAVIWNRLERLRWAGWLISLPLFKQMSWLAYELGAVPVLATYNTYRKRRNARTL